VERPRRRHPARPRGGPGRLPGLRPDHLPRPLVPRPHLHPPPGIRGRRPGDVVPGELVRIRGVAGEEPGGHGVAPSAAPIRAPTRTSGPGRSRGRLWCQDLFGSAGILEGLLEGAGDSPAVAVAATTPATAGVLLTVTVAIPVSASAVAVAIPVAATAAATAAVAAVTAFTAPAASFGPAVAAVAARLRQRGPRQRFDQVQAELAAVDAADSDLDLVAELQVVLHPLDPLGGVELGDVQQTVGAGEDVHERTELGDVHDLALVLGPDLGLRRVGDLEDPL